jgi:RNA polymerase sigma-70 factor (sigma-E family)
MDTYQGFDQFVTSRTAALSRVAFLLTGDHHLAQDLLQTALSRVAARWPRVREGNPEAYVRRCLINEFTSWRRQRRYHELPVESIKDSPVGGELASSVERRVLVGRALARLTPRQRAVLVLRFYEDLSEAATAQIMGITIGTVKSQTSHALSRLRRVAPELVELIADTNGKRP